MLASVQDVARASGRIGLCTRLAIALVCVVATGCSQAKLNNVSPARAPIERALPSPIDTVMDGFSVHLDPTVMLWAQDAEVDLPATVRTALATVQRRLRGPNTTIEISAGSYYTIPGIGIGGSTDTHTGTVRVSMDAKSRVPLHRLLTLWLPVTLAHELHHSKRVIDGPGYGETLLESMVSEGGAIAFAAEVYPDAPTVPWLVPMTDTQEEATWRKARSQLSRSDDIDRHHAWFFGGGELPRFAGYKLGYSIVRSYLEAQPGTTPVDLASLEAAKVLEGSRFGS